VDVAALSSETLASLGLFLELIVLAALALKVFPEADGSFLAATPLRLGVPPRPPAAAPGRLLVAGDPGSSLVSVVWTSSLAARRWGGLGGGGLAYCAGRGHP
jgi:hypothetical protein